MGRTITRRGFFSILAAAVAGTAAVAIDPERLNWSPGQKTHILPPAGGWGIKPIPPFTVGFDPAAASSDKSAWVVFEYDKPGVIGRCIEPMKYDHWFVSDKTLAECAKLQNAETEALIKAAVKQLAEDIDKQLFMGVPIKTSPLVPKDMAVLQPFSYRRDLLRSGFIVEGV